MSGEQSDGARAVGVVHAVLGGVYDVLTTEGERLDASLRGRIKRDAAGAGRVVIGDEVVLSRSAGAWTIEEVAERRTRLVRRGRTGRAPKVVAANLDRVFVVVSLERPRATRELIDRLLALVESSGMHPTLVLNKADLDEERARAARLTRDYAGIGYDVLVTSAETGRGVEAMRAAMCTGSSAVIGPSGVGKSSLLNAIDGGLDLATGALSRKTGTGRHTTVGSRLVPLSCGGLVADTPGFGEVGLWAVAPDEVAACFPELDELAEGCRFRGCTHLHEPECAVRDAVERGAVLESRFASYATLRGEAEEADRRV